MRRALVGTFALLLAGLAPARAAGPVDPAAPQGAKCRFSSSVDVTTEQGRQTGATTGGPVAVAAVGTVPVTCTVYVNGAYATSVSGSPVAAGTITYRAGVTDIVTMCTSVTYGGKTYYWQPRDSPWGVWSETLDVNACNGYGFGFGDANSQACPVLLTIDEYGGTDLAGVWQDCEPYEPIL